MKKIIICMAGAFAWVVLNVSCDKMNDIHQKYFDEGERVYLAMPDSAIVYPGSGRVKIAWFVDADPKVETTVIFWNMRQDSIEKKFTRIHDDIQADSIIIDTNMDGTPLAEDSYVFELVNKNIRGERSLTTIVEGRSYGEKYEKSLLNRTVNSILFNGEQGSLNITWNEISPTEAGVRLDYTDVQGVSRTMWVDKSETATSIPNFKLGGQLFYTTFHKPVPEAIDMFQAPTTRIPYTANLTHLLKNTQKPFATGDMVLDDRWYTALNWSANEVAAGNGNVDNGNGYELCLAAWRGTHPNVPLENGKLYQTVELEAATYTFEAFIVLGPANVTVGSGYVVANLGNGLPDMHDVAGQALGYTPILPGTANVNLSVQFVLTQKSTVSLGFVANLDHSHLYIRNVVLQSKF